MPSTARQVHALRILVRPHAGTSAQRVRIATRRALASTRWGAGAAVRVAPISPDVPDTLVIEVDVADPIGLYLLLTDREFRDALDRPARAAPERVPRAASPQLRTLLRS